MPLILQAANQGTPVINLNIAPLFDGLFHLSPVDQNIIISDASNLLGQEIQEFIGSLLVTYNR